MITAVIVGRENSSRLFQKHFNKIGKYNIFENILFNLKKSKKISQFIFATGSKKKNKNYINFFKQKKIDTFDFNEENNVTKRIYLLTKNINTKYTLIVSGDCPLPDYSFIDYCSDQLENNSYYEFLRPKRKVFHEGLILFKTKAWKKVYLQSKSKIFKENPGYILKKKPQNFKIYNFTPRKSDTRFMKLRFSIDTLSDLYFFRLLNYNLKNKFLDLKDLTQRKINKFREINNKVTQIIPEKTIKSKIGIITIYNKKFGLGHLKRSSIIYQNLIDRSFKNVKIFNFTKSKNKNSIIKDINQNNIKLFNSKTIKELDYLFIDLPKEIIEKQIKKLKLKKTKVTFIDNLPVKFNSKYSAVIPSLNKISTNSNIFSGSENLILDKRIMFENLKEKIKLRYDYLFLTGGTKELDLKTIHIINSKLKNHLVVVGPYVSKSYIKILKEKKINFLKDPHNIYELIKESKNILCYFGITTYEILALNKKPVIIFEASDKKTQRYTDVMNLIKKDLAISFELFLDNLKLNKKMICKKKLNFKYDCNFLEMIIK